MIVPVDITLQARLHLSLKQKQTTSEKDAEKHTKSKGNRPEVSDFINKGLASLRSVHLIDEQMKNAVPFRIRFLLQFLSLLKIFILLLERSRVRMSCFDFFLISGIFFLLLFSSLNFLFQFFLQLLSFFGLDFLQLSPSLFEFHVNDPQVACLLVVSSFADLLPDILDVVCLLYTSPSPRDLSTSRMPSSA